MARSRSRTTARASSRFATLVHAINSSKLVAASSIHRPRVAFSVITSCSGRAVKLYLSIAVVARHLRSEIARARGAPHRPSCPSRSRPNDNRKLLPRFDGSADRPSGSHTIEPPHFGEPGRRDADDRVVLAIDLHRRAQHRWRLLKSPLPQSFADHDHAIAAACDPRRPRSSGRSRAGRRSL